VVAVRLATVVTLNYLAQCGKTCGSGWALLRTAVRIGLTFPEPRCNIFWTDAWLCESSVAGSCAIPFSFCALHGANAASNTAKITKGRESIVERKQFTMEPPIFANEHIGAFSTTHQWLGSICS